MLHRVRMLTDHPAGDPVFRAGEEREVDAVRYAILIDSGLAEDADRPPRPAAKEPVTARSTRRRGR